MTQSLLMTAERLAEDVLFPAALATDAAERVPEQHLRALADAGMFGVVGPREHGGRELGPELFSTLVEVLASGCLATTFVFIQHHGAIQALTASANTALALEWLPDLCAGRRRAGLALAGARPGPAPLMARPVPGGYLLQGSAPWVTGWTLVDAVLTLARTRDQQTLSVLVDAAPSDTLQANPLALVACNSSCTVELSLLSHFVPNERVLSLVPYVPPPDRDGGGRSNGSLALGVIRRSCLLLGPSPLDAELIERRQRLDEADDSGLAAARAAAVALALRASAALITRSGSRSIAGASHAQRLAREALFLLVFGSRPAIREALLHELGAEAAGSY